MDYSMIGLSNFIFENYKKPLFDYYNEVRVDGLESRYTNYELFYNMDSLVYKVHNKVMEKLADKISDDVVNRILEQIDKNKKKDKNE